MPKLLQLLKCLVKFAKYVKIRTLIGNEPPFSVCNAPICNEGTEALSRMLRNVEGNIIIHGGRTVFGDCLYFS